MNARAQQVFYNELLEEFPAPDPERVNILVVDDLPEKLVAYEAILEELGQNIVTARSGEEALKMVLKDEFAVILLDVNMPGLDGFETASLIRKRRKSSHTPMIFLTAFTDEIRMAQGYASGAVDYLPTPVVPEILKAKVRVFIELSQMRRRAALQAQEHALRTAAEVADRRKDEFLAMLAHELRNPLAPIRNALEAMKRSPEAALREEAQQTIERQLQHLVQLVDDLMDVSRITQGKIKLRKEPMRLQQALDQALEISQPLMQQHAHTLRTQLAAEDVWLQADAGRMAQIFSNLLNNAAKYTNHGGVIELSSSVRDGKVSIRVRDNGIGIPTSMLADIFDLFSQVDTSLERTQGGLGIGLTLVKRLVEMHDGTVSARSDGPNKGSEFCVTLPTIEAPEDTESSEASAATADVRPLKILICDDNEASAKTMGWMLEMDGHETKLVHSGTDAIDAAKGFHPDMVLLDIGLPGLNGYETCKILRQTPGMEKTVFIAQTGWGQEEHRRRSKEAGFDHHLVKPIDAQLLQQIINRPAAH